MSAFRCIRESFTKESRHNAACLKKGKRKRALGIVLRITLAYLRSTDLPERMGEPRKLAARTELLVLVLRKMFGGMLELDLRPTTSLRSDRFILAVTSPLLSPVCNSDNRIVLTKYDVRKQEQTTTAKGGYFLLLHCLNSTERKRACILLDINKKEL